MSKRVAVLLLFERECESSLFGCVGFTAFSFRGMAVSSSEESESESELSESLSESESTGGATIPLYIAHAIEPIYTTNVEMNTTPPNRPKEEKKSMNRVKSVVNPNKALVYILAERSKVMDVGAKIRPREKAPRILEMEDPRMFPRAREDCCCEMEAITTTS